EVETARQAGRLKVDYLGILLIAIGFACLEVVLDRGERLDWFESNFIVAFFAIAIVALVVAVVWELRQQDPVVELRLLRERNFALSNAFYFLFGFVLFGSTVLIPQMLQSLYGYTATDAGLVLGPGAMVIVVMAPLIVRLVKRIPMSWMIGFGFTILGCALWYFASFDRTFSENVQSIANRFVDHGYSAADAAMRAVAQVHAVVQQQANILAFLDCFWLLGLVAFIGPVLALFIRKFKQGGTAGAH